jgi:hypothetical protein
MLRHCNEPCTPLTPVPAGDLKSRGKLKIWIHKGVTVGYTPCMKTKDAGLRIRVERQLRDEFLEACRLQDRPAAQVLREFMRRYVAENKAESQASLFPLETTPKAR